MGNFILSQYKIVNLFGDIIAIPIIITIIIGMIFILDKHKRELIILLITTASYPASLLLKLLFRHPRPEDASVTNLIFADNYSFPSSHTMFYTAFWGYLLYLSLRMEHENKILRLFVFILSVYFISLVGISRVTSSAHFPKDVLAGYGFGFLYLLFIVLLDLKMKRFISDDNTDNKDIELM